MKPIIILPPDEIKPEDIAILRENGLCVVEAKHPHEIKFVDPIPSFVQRTKIESAAISLSRMLLTGNGLTTGKSYGLSHAAVTQLYVDCLLKGTSLQEGPTQEERERAYFTSAKMDEIKQMAREEARAEREAQKKQKPKQPGA